MQLSGLPGQVKEFEREHTHMGIVLTTAFIIYLNERGDTHSGGHLVVM